MNNALSLLTFNQSLQFNVDVVSHYRERVFERYKDEIISNSEILIKYKGYIEREKNVADKISHLENLIIPDNYDFDSVSGLSIECRQKFKKYNPRTIGQASRISGVSPSDISILLMHFGR